MVESIIRPKRPKLSGKRAWQWPLPIQPINNRHASFTVTNHQIFPHPRYKINSIRTCITFTNSCCVFNTPSSPFGHFVIFPRIFLNELKGRNGRDLRQKQILSVHSYFHRHPCGSHSYASNHDGSEHTRYQRENVCFQ
jgi:hypothetical protein